MERGQGEKIQELYIGIYTWMDGKGNMGVLYRGELEGDNSVIGCKINYFLVFLEESSVYKVRNMSDKERKGRRRAELENSRNNSSTI